MATPGGKESLQLFRMAVAIFSEGGKRCWYRDYHLVRVRCLVRVRDVYLLFGTRSSFSTGLSFGTGLLFGTGLSFGTRS